MRIRKKILTFILALSLLLPGLVQASPAQAKEREIVRLAGPNRVATSIKVSGQAYQKADAVVLAGYNGEVDALTGAILASAKEAPLILVTKDKLGQEVKEEITRLGAKNVYILGGQASVGKAVEEELAQGHQVKRIAGADREATALAVAKEIKEQVDHVFLANGYEVLADALAVGPASAKQASPILLTRSQELSAASLKALRDLGVEKITLVGGEKTISKEVEAQLKDFSLDRVSGKNREETALALAQKYFGQSKTAILANGYQYADALVGGYFGAKIDSPILLTAADRADGPTLAYLEKQVDKVYILGGEASINKGVLDPASKEEAQASFEIKSVLGVYSLEITLASGRAQDVSKVLVNGQEKAIKSASGTSIRILEPTSMSKDDTIQVVINGKTITASPKN